MTHLLADTAVLLRRELLRYARDRAYWIGQLVFPLALVGIIGLGLDDVVALPSGRPYVAHLATGVLVLVAGSGAVGGGFSLIEDRESGFLRALLVAPVSRASIVLAKLAARLLVTLGLLAVVGGALTLVAPLGLPHPLAALGSISAVTAVFAALGIALAARLSRLDSFRLLAGVVTMPMYLFSGIFYPVSTLPAPMRALAWVNPLTYAVDLFRYGLLGAHELPLAASALLLAVLATGAVALSVRAFAWGVEA